MCCMYSTQPKTTWISLRAASLASHHSVTIQQLQPIVCDWVHLSVVRLFSLNYSPPFDKPFFQDYQRCVSWKASPRKMQEKRKRERRTLRKIGKRPWQWPCLPLVLSSCALLSSFTSALVPRVPFDLIVTFSTRFYTISKVKSNVFFISSFCPHHQQRHPAFPSHQFHRKDWQRLPLCALMLVGSCLCIRTTKVQ